MSTFAYLKHSNEPDYYKMLDSHQTYFLMRGWGLGWHETIYDGSLISCMREWTCYPNLTVVHYKVVLLSFIFLSFNRANELCASQ